MSGTRTHQEPGITPQIGGFTAARGFTPRRQESNLRTPGRAGKAPTSTLRRASVRRGRSTTPVSMVHKGMLTVRPRRSTSTGPDHHRQDVQAAGESAGRRRLAIPMVSPSESSGSPVNTSAAQSRSGTTWNRAKRSPTGHRPDASAGRREGSTDPGRAVQRRHWGWLLVPMTLRGWDNGHRPSSGSVVALLQKETPSGGPDDAARA